jgi:hypothetical protein
MTFVLRLTDDQHDDLYSSRYYAVCCSAVLHLNKDTPSPLDRD